MEFCPYCSPEAQHPLASNPLAQAWDLPGENPAVVITPRRHNADFGRLKSAEQQAIWGLLAEQRQRLQEQFGPAGFKIEIRIGSAAGQRWSHTAVVLTTYFNNEDDFSSDPQAPGGATDYQRRQPQPALG